MDWALSWLILVMFLRMKLFSSSKVLTFFCRAIIALTYDLLFTYVALRWLALRSDELFSLSLSIEEKGLFPKDIVSWGCSEGLLGWWLLFLSIWELWLLIKVHSNPRLGDGTGLDICFSQYSSCLELTELFSMVSYSEKTDVNCRYIQR